MAMEGRHWQRPEPCQPGEAPPLTPEQVGRFRSAGALVLDGLWPADLVAAATLQAEARYPAPELLPPGFQIPYGTSPAPRNHIRFPMEPSVLGALNEITVHPRILAAAAQLLGTDDLRCTQSNILPKYGEVPGGSPDVDGQLHHDYGANMFVAPPRQSPDAVVCILYLSGTGAETGGPTNFVFQEGAATFDRSAVAGGVDNGAIVLGEDVMATKYEIERSVQYAPGTCLLFRIDTWHRATKNLPGQRRLTQHIILRCAEAEWVQSDCWVPRFAEMPGSDFVGKLSVRQRSALGFPPPGHPCWSVQAIEAAARRYPGFDPAPYAAAAG